MLFAFFLFVVDVLFVVQITVVEGVEDISAYGWLSLRPSWDPSSATIVCQGDTFTFKLDQALADNGGIYLVIEASEGQSNGVSRAHAKASAIKMVEEPTAAAVDIRADYVAKNGAPSAAAPKIFFRYYYVNSSTGEKSGTMLAEVTWSAAAAGGEP